MLLIAIKNLKGVGQLPPSLPSSTADLGLYCIFQYLLTCWNLDVNKQNYSGETALMYAVTREHVNVVKLLLNVPGIDLDIENFIKTSSLKTPRHMAL